MCRILLNINLIGGENMASQSVKRIASVVFSLLFLLLSSLSTYADSAEIKVSAPTEVKSGRSFDVAVNLHCDVPIAAVQFLVSYDENMILFKSARCRDGEIYLNEETGETEIICLFSSGISSGELLTLTFTAQSGSQGSQTLAFACIQAVSLEMNEVGVNIENSVNIDIVSSGGSEKSSSASNAKAPISSKNTPASAKTTSNEVSHGKNSGILSSIKSDSDYDSSNHNATGGSVIEYSNGGEKVGYLSQDDKRFSYVMAGVGGTLSVIMILFAVFRAGQMSKKHTGILPPSVNNDKEN